MQLGCGSGEDGEGAVQMGRGSGELTVEAVEQGGVLSDVVGCGGCSCKKKGGDEWKVYILAGAAMAKWDSAYLHSGERRRRRQAQGAKSRSWSPATAAAGRATASAALWTATARGGRDGEGPQTLAARRDAEKMQERGGSGRAARWGNMREGGGSAGWLSAVRLACWLVMACRSAGLNG